MDFELPAAVITGMPHRLNHLPTVPGFSVDMFSPERNGPEYCPELHYRVYDCRESLRKRTSD